jgi:hypothetical protein
MADKAAIIIYTRLTKQEWSVTTADRAAMISYTWLIKQQSSDTHG